MRLLGLGRPQQITPVEGNGATQEGSTLAQKIGIGPNSKPTQWSIQKAFRNLSVGACLLGTLLGGGNMASAQVAANLNVVPGAVLNVNVGEVVAAKKVVFDGVIRGNQISASSANNRFNSDDFESYTANGEEAVSRGFLRTSAQPIEGGARLTVKTFHADKNDKLTLWLMAEVLDKSTNQLRTITLSTLEDRALINKESYRGTLTYDINYDELNAFLKTQNPNLQIVPGRTSLGVTALWENGHQAGGFGRNGKFTLPALAGAGVIQPLTPNGAPVASTDAAIERNTPLHLTVNYPAEIVSAVPQLPSEGNVLSLLETEIKGVPISLDALIAAKKKMYELCELAKQGRTAEVEAVLGPGWTVETRSRYWIKDDGKPNLPGTAGTGAFKGFRVGADGLPLQDPMVDVYMDNSNLGITHNKGANRLRVNSAGAVLNVKIGWNVSEQATSILPSVLTRLEYILMMNPGTTPQAVGQAVRAMANGSWENSVLNLPQKEFRQLDGSVILADAMGPWLQITQDRHKFTVKNAAGLEVEYSFDVVRAKTLRPEHANRDGSPRVVEFYVAEAELDHLEFQNKQRAAANTTVTNNAVSVPATSGGNVLAPGSVQVGSFLNAEEQKEWLAQAGNVTMDVDPRLHTLKDLKTNDIGLSTSHAMFKENMEFMLPKLFPDGLTDGAQKAAESGHRMGLVFWADSEIMPAVEREFKELGYRWTPELDREFQALLGDPTKKVALERAMANGSTQNVLRFLQETIGNQDRALDIDSAQMTGRFTDRLRELGFKSTPAVEGMFARIHRKDLKPAEIEGLFEGMANVADTQIVAAWAKALGVKAVQPQADVQLLLGEETGYGVRLRASLEAAQIDPKQVRDIEAFLVKAAASGKVSMADIRATIRDLASYEPEATLKGLGEKAGIVAEVPVLRTTSGAIAAAAHSSLNRQHYILDGQLMKFFGEVAKKLSRREALSWAQGIDNPATAIAEQAKKLNVAAPKLTLDLERIDGSATTSLRRSHVTYTAEVKAFVHQLVENGVQVSTVLNALDGMSYQPSLAKAFEDVKVNGAALQNLPNIEYDRASIAGAVTANLQTYLPVLGGRASIDKLIEDLLKKNFTPSQVITWASVGIASGQQWAYGLPNGIDKTTLPKLAVDFRKLNAEWKAAFGNEWTAAREAYAKDAFAKAMAKDDFYLSRVYTPNMGAPNSGSTFDSILSTLEQASGVKRPQGV